MNITSPAFSNGGEIPEEYTADGENVNPELHITDLPEGTKSLVLVVDDPDAERVVGYTWIHWVVLDIPVKGHEVIIEKDSIPGIPGDSTYKKEKYCGPNPPKGTGVHNYHFRVYALKEFLQLPEGIPYETMMEKMDGEVLGRAELVGIYSRD